MADDRRRRKPPFRKKTGKRPPRSHSKASAKEGARGWDPVAAWYDQLVGKNGSDYHRNVVLPAAMEMLGELKGKAVLDVCCGQGVLVPLLRDRGASRVLGVDASPRLIESARQRFGEDPHVSFEVADACAPGHWADGPFDTVSCLMAVHDVSDLEGMCRNMASALKVGGRFVAIFMHPCFRIPQQTHWGWDEGRKLQYRRIDRYGVNLEIPIRTHPGRPESSETSFYHRPLGEVLNSFGTAGLAVTETRELMSHRRSQAGGHRSKGEHRAAREFPVFLAIAGQRIAS